MKMMVQQGGKEKLIFKEHHIPRNS